MWSGNGGSRVDDCADGPEEALLVVTRGVRRARDEDDAASVPVDVALEERDFMLVRSGLDAPDEPVEGVGDGLRALALDEIVDPAEADERDRGVSVLALERSHLEQLRAERARHSDLDAEPRDVRERLDGSRDLWLADKEHAAPVGRLEERIVEFCGSLRAQEDLAGDGLGLELDGPRRGRARDEELAMRVADEEEVESVAVNADVHLQMCDACRRLRAADRAQPPPHAEGRAGGPSRMVFPREEQEKSVSAELQQPAAVRVRELQQGRERRVHDVRDLLCACLAQAREPLGHGGEAGDVHERERSVDLDPAAVGVVAEPFERQPGNERDEFGRRGFIRRWGGHAGHCASAIRWIKEGRVSAAQRRSRATSQGAVRSATAPAWELHQLFDGCPSVLAYQDGSWMVSVQGRTAAGDSLDEVLTQALERRSYGFPAASVATASP